jgi:hypothetical protein
VLNVVGLLQKMKPNLIDPSAWFRLQSVMRRACERSLSHSRAFVWVPLPVPFPLSGTSLRSALRSTVFWPRLLACRSHSNDFFRRYTQIPLTLCSCVALCIVHRARIGPNNNDGFVINKPRSPPSPEVGKINHEKRSHIIIDFDLRATYEYEWPMSDRFYPTHRSVPAQQPPVPLLFAKHGLPLRTNTLAPGQSPLFLHRTFTATHGNMGGWDVLIGVTVLTPDRRGQCVISSVCLMSLQRAQSIRQ